MDQLKTRLIKNSTISLTDSLTDSIIFAKKDMIPTSVPMINVALSGTVDGGMIPGLTMLAGPSKHFKTGFALLLASSFLRKYKDGIILFYDSEFGTPISYFETFGIPKDQVVHTPIMDIEELKFDIIKQLKEITRSDHVMIIIDSIGNLASKKEVEDAIDGKSVADMSRAKQLKSLFRMVTPYLTLKNIPCIAVNHTYKEIGLYPKDIVGGGTGSYYSSNDIWIIGRQQDKDGKELAGYNFVIKIEKSRMVRETSKIPITIAFDGGINRWSGLLDIALAGNYVAKPNVGWYSLVDRKTGEIDGIKMRAADIENNKDFWIKMFKDTDFAKYIESKYKMVQTSILEEEEV
jgi:RecA/RadA recombinase